MKYKYSTKQLQQAVIETHSIYGVMELLGIRRSGGSHSNISRRIKLCNIDISHFTGQSWNKGKTFTKKNADVVLIEYPEDNARIQAKMLRRSLKERGVEERCVECGIAEIYNNKPIRLHVDHINGVFTDCRQDNLRFLCPNCHSQTENFGNRTNIENQQQLQKENKTRYLNKEKHPCQQCGSPTKRSFKYCSYACSNFGQRKVERPTKEDLLKMINESSYLAVSRQFGVSDNAIRKWVKK